MKYINGFDHPDVVAGQGTIGLEILEDVMIILIKTFLIFDPWTALSYLLKRWAAVTQLAGRPQEEGRSSKKATLSYFFKKQQLPIVFFEKNFFEEKLMIFGKKMSIFFENFKNNR